MKASSVGVPVATASGGAPLAPGALLRSRRAAVVFALLVFLTTVIQVLSVPVTALLDGVTEWGLVVREPVVVLLLVLGCAAQAAAVALSGRRPRIAVVVVVGLYLLLALGLAVPSWLRGMYLVIALALFLLATRVTPTVAIVWAAGVSLVAPGMLFAWAIGVGTDVDGAVAYVLAEAAALAAPTMGGTALGIWWAVQVRRVTRAREAAEAATREHAERVAAAESRERARIAQELHDVAGQHLAGLMTLADAAVAIAQTQPEDAIDLVREVRDEGRFAAASLAGALSDLRAVDTAHPETTRDLQHTEELVHYWRRHGMRVDLTITGRTIELPAVVSTTAYRALQEALTNAAKHAPGAAVAIAIRRDPHLLHLTVDNDAARDDTPGLRGLDLGWGLTGIREHVELLGGTLVASPTSPGGWHLSCDIPLAPTL